MHTSVTKRSGLSWSRVLHVVEKPGNNHVVEPFNWAADLKMVGGYSVLFHVQTKTKGYNEFPKQVEVHC